MAYSKHGQLYQLKKAGAVWSYDYGWELNDEFIGEHHEEAYHKLMEIKGHKE